MGHDVLSDFADRPEGDPLLGLYKNCGFWTHSEAAILFNIAKLLKGDWLDIGAHTGWTAVHQAAAGCCVWAVDNMLAVPEFADRFDDNVMESELDEQITPFAGTSNEFFAAETGPHLFSGIVIDGDHCAPCPLEDAKNAESRLTETGVILFHDFIGRPVREGVEYLMSEGFKCKIYWTPHMVACCWRGDLLPPHHIPDPRINWTAVKAGMPDFDFARCA
jgi:hypothetical protein